MLLWLIQKLPKAIDETVKDEATPLVTLEREIAASLLAWTSAGTTRGISGIPLLRAPVQIPAMLEDCTYKVGKGIRGIKMKLHFLV